MKQRSWNGIKVLILGLAMAAFLVPAAQGYVYFGSGSDTPDSLKGISFYQSSSPALEQALAKSKAAYTPQALQAMNQRWTKLADSYQASRPDDRAGARGADWWNSPVYKPLTTPAETVGGDIDPIGWQKVYAPAADRAGALGIGGVNTSDYVDRQVANLEAKSGIVVHADDRGGIHGPGPVETPTVVSSHDGFDWTDAGIGASAMLFLAAMLAAVMLVRKRPSLAV